MKQENKQKISKIIMKPKAICFCPLGNDWYTNEFEVEFVPDKTFPDYCDVEKFLNTVIRGETLIIEDAVSIFYNYLKAEYDPLTLKVTAYVNDVTSHSPVVVIRE